MKKYIIITILTFFAALNCISQTVQVNQKDSTIFKASTYAGAIVYVKGRLHADTLIITVRDTTWHPVFAGTLTTPDGATLYIWNGVKWNGISGGSGSTERFGIEDNLGIQDRSVDMGAFQFDITANNGGRLFQLENTGLGKALIARSGGIATFITSSSNLGLDVNTSNSTGIGSAQFTVGYVNPADNTVLQNIIVRRVTDGTPTAGIGSSIDFDTRTVSSNAYSNRLISQWADPVDASKTSQFQISGYNNAVEHFLTFPSLTADRYSPISVNGNYADAAGNITVSGGGAERFGIEDSTSTVHRYINFEGHSLVVDSLYSFSSRAGDAASDGAYSKLYQGDNILDNYVQSDDSHYGEVYISPSSAGLYAFDDDAGINSTFQVVNDGTISAKGHLDSAAGVAPNIVGIAPDGNWHKYASGGGTTTNALTFNNGGAGDASGTTFNGSAARTLSYNSIGAVPTTRTVNGKALSGNITLGLASSDFANQGTTTTVLHGNASGNPSFAAVDLVNDITGTLASGNGGTGFSTYTKGDLIYASATNTLSKLAIGATANKALTVSATGVPQWGSYIDEDSVIITRTSLGTYTATGFVRSQNGLRLQNTTAATNVLNQYSPPLIISGQGWNSSNSTSLPVDFNFAVAPNSAAYGGGATSATGTLSLTSSGSLTSQFTFSSAGAFVATGNVTGNGVIGGFGQFTTAAALTSAQIFVNAGSTYRTTNGGGTITPALMMGGSSTAGIPGLNWDATNQISFTVMNDAATKLKIMTAAIGVTGVTSTAGSEASNLSFYTMASGAAAAERMVLSSAGNLSLNNGNLTLATAGNKIVITEGTDGRVGQTVLVTGTKAITINGLTTSSRAFVQLVSPSGATLTVQYQAVCTSNTLTIQANLGATTINAADGSTLNYFVLN